MRFGFNFMEAKDESDGRQLLTSPSSSTPKEDIQWVPLQHHPVFSAINGGSTLSLTSKMPTNLLAWDGASRLYFWDSNKQCLHRISIRLGEPDPTSILAASPSKVLQADVDLEFEVYKISINRNGSALLLSGLEGLYVMYLYGRTSAKTNTIISRTVSIGSEIYFNRNNVIRTLQTSWHPYSDTHLGILSSDSVFRIFNLSSALEQPEQEYYLQPVEPGTSHKAASICPVGFSFGGDHLWDRFSVFVLYSDGSVYILCPVVPFGSVYKWESLLEIYNDAQMFGLKSSHSKAVNNSSLAISWLEATYPELGRHAEEGGNLFALKAQPYALFDASVVLQGPLRKLCHLEEESDFDIQGTMCEGRAVSFLYNLVSKDSILITAWSGGQLQIDALADEIQPVWKAGSRPRLCVDSYGHVTGVAMICESVSSDLSMLKLDQTPDHTVWLGHPPPLLRLAIVDLALPGKSASLISMLVDPLIPERIYCLHDGGVDSVMLRFLPFTNQTSGKGDKIKTPSVDPVLSSCPGETSSSHLCGFLALSGSFGDSWIVGLTSSSECIVLEMKTWNALLPLDKDRNFPNSDEPKAIETGTIISKELLNGPKVVFLPPSTNLRSVAADTIEGRSALHQYCKLFHENYVEYAHKVYFELEHHAPRLKEIIDDLHCGLRKANQKLLKVEEKQAKLKDRVDHAVQFHARLELHLRNLRNLPGAHKKPLSKAEKEFKLQLDRFSDTEMDALHSSIDVLNSRLKRYLQHSSSPSPSPAAAAARLSNQISRRTTTNTIQEDEISRLKSSVEKLSLVNNDNTKKVKAIESALRSCHDTDNL